MLFKERLFSIRGISCTSAWCHNLRLYELVVKVNVIRFTHLQSPGGNQHRNEQRVLRVCRIENVNISNIRDIGDILLPEFLDSSMNYIGTGYMQKSP